MKRVLLLVSILAAVAGHADRGRFERFCSRTEQGRSDRGFPCANAAEDFAFFELAPTSGAGMSSPCAGIDVTGAKGEAVTWNRASAAGCLRQGLAATGILNGDFVQVPANRPRVVPNGAGTNGLLFEASRTNYLNASSDLTDIGNWFSASVGVAAPTITANAGIAPDGTMTATRVQVPACPNPGDYSIRYQNLTTFAGDHSIGTFFKLNAGAGQAQSIYFLRRATGVGAAVACAPLNGDWIWCGGPLSSSQLTVNTAGSDTQFGFGCVNTAGFTGASNTGAADLLVWQPDVQNGTRMSMPIVTVPGGGTVTRAPDYGASVSSVSLASLATSGCFAVSLTPTIPPPPPAGAFGRAGYMASAGQLLTYSRFANTIRAYDGTTEPTIVSGFALGVTKRYRTVWSASANFSVRNVTDNVVDTVAFDGSMATTGPLLIGAGASAGEEEGWWILSRLALDPSTTAPGCL